MGRRGHAVKHKVRFVDSDESPEKNSFPDGEESTEGDRPQTPVESGESTD